MAGREPYEAVPRITRFEPDAERHAQHVLDRYALDLAEESRRIAKRHHAPSISVEYVRQAAMNLSLTRRGTAVADLVVAIGIAMLTAAISVLATSQAAPDALADWVDPASIVCIAIGSALISIGITLKATANRR